MIDILLKLPSPALTRNRHMISGLTTAFKARAFGKHLFTSAEGGNMLINSTHEMAVHVIEDLPITPAILDEEGNVITPAVTEGLHLMIRIVEGTPTAIAWLASRGNLPAGVAEVVNPGTVGWSD